MTYNIVVGIIIGALIVFLVLYEKKKKKPQS